MEYMAGEQRERRLILEGSPCGVDYFNPNILTVLQAQAIGLQRCQNWYECENADIYCTLSLGLEVAQHVVTGKTLERELADFT